jgi:hypothetical protein
LIATLAGLEDILTTVSSDVGDLRPEAEFLDESRQKSEEFSSLLFTVTSTTLPWDF